MKDCVFCKILQGSIPAAKVHEDDEFVCIRDISPQAKTHLLVFPKEHIPSLNEFFPENLQTRPLLMGKLFEFAVRIAKEQGLSPAGFRTVFNTGSQAGQTVFHVHLHILGGEPLGAFGA